MIADATADVTDCYQEAHDPENVFSIDAQALFEIREVEVDDLTTLDGTTWADAYTLIGMTTDDGHGPQFHTREQTIALMGMEAVWRWEAHMDDQGMAMHEWDCGPLRRVIAEAVL